VISLSAARQERRNAGFGCAEVVLCPRSMSTHHAAIEHVEFVTETVLGAELGL
jgi:hypothetical protein